MIFLFYFFVKHIELPDQKSKTKFVLHSSFSIEVFLNIFPFPSYCSTNSLIIILMYISIPTNRMESYLILSQNPIFFFTLLVQFNNKRHLSVYIGIYVYNYKLYILCKKYIKYMNTSYNRLWINLFNKNIEMMNDCRKIIL